MLSLCLPLICSLFQENGEDDTLNNKMIEKKVYLDTEELETSVHGSGSEEGGVFAELGRGGHGRVVVEGAEAFPLLDEIHADVAAGHREVSTGLVKGQILDFVGVVQIDGLEVLQLPQIP